MFVPLIPVSAAETVEYGLPLTSVVCALYVSTLSILPVVADVLDNAPVLADEELEVSAGNAPVLTDEELEVLVGNAPVELLSVDPVFVGAE